MTPLVKAKAPDDVVANLLVQIAIAEYERETDRINRLEQRAGILLGFNGIFLALLLSGIRYTEHLIVYLLLICIGCFTISAVAMCISFFTGKINRFPLKKFCNYTTFEKEPRILAGEIIASYRNSLEYTFVLRLRALMINIGVTFITMGIIMLVANIAYYIVKGG